MKIKTDFRLVRKMAYTLSANRLLRVMEDVEAEIGDKYYQYEDDCGNLLFIREENQDLQGSGTLGY